MTPAEYLRQKGINTPLRPLTERESQELLAINSAIPQSGGGGTSAIWGNITGTLSNQTDLQTALNAKSPIASPTFTGTVTTPAIIVSAETADRVVILDATKNIKSADTAIYPSLTELSYVKGATSALQTQINTKAPIASPTFTGVPAAPTAADGTDTTQVATTEFVQNALATSSSVGSKLFLYYNFT